MEGFLLFLVGAIFYFFPVLAARERGHKNLTAITVLTVVAGWTVIGWVAALVWAFTSNVEGT